MNLLQKVPKQNGLKAGISQICQGFLGYLKNLAADMDFQLL